MWWYSAEDQSQRMPNTLEVGTHVPIHRHLVRGSTGFRFLWGLGIRWWWRVVLSWRLRMGRMVRGSDLAAFVHRPLL